MTLDVNVAEDLVPISRLGAGSKYVRAVVDSGRPKVVTEGGVGVAVILDVETFEALQSGHAAGELERDLRTALAEADAGSLLEHEAVMTSVRQQFAGRVSPKASRRLGAP